MQGVIHIRDCQTGTVYPCRVGFAVQIGRADVNSNPEVPCKDPHVSRRHCELHAQQDGRIRIVDRSSYGTYVNSNKIQGEGVAQAGDRLVLGYSYAFQVLNPQASGAATHAQGSGSPADTDSNALTAAQGGGIGAANIPGQIGTRYRVIREIGRGGMGVVYEAHDAELNQSCAIKVLHEASEFDRTERFKREARLAAKLGDYPAIVRVYDCGTLHGGQSLYLVMDFVDGVSLAQLAQTGVKRSLGVRLVARTARAVDYAHVRGVVHRDLKPENVLVTRDYNIRLTDFGIAKEDGSGLTMTGIAMGTPNFMAPEQIEDSKRVGPLADVYGLGGILYAVLTGQPPYTGKRVGEILRKVQRGDLVPPSQLVPGLEQALDSVCRRALSVDMSLRPQSAAAFAKELETWLKQNVTSSGPVRLEFPPKG